MPTSVAADRGTSALTYYLRQTREHVDQVYRSLIGDRDELEAVTATVQALETLGDTRIGRLVCASRNQSISFLGLTPAQRRDVVHMQGDELATFASHVGALWYGRRAIRWVQFALAQGMLTPRINYRRVTEIAAERGSRDVGVVDVALEMMPDTGLLGRLDPDDPVLPRYQRWLAV